MKVEELEHLVINLRKQMKQLHKQQSKYDRELSGIYHEIETSNYHASQGYKAYVKLREHLKERRKVKGELGKYNNLLSGFNSVVRKHGDITEVSE